MHSIKASSLSILATPIFYPNLNDRGIAWRECIVEGRATIETKLVDGLWGSIMIFAPREFSF
jgi:hypothetical protein